MEYAPKWLRELVNDVAKSSDSLETDAELSCHVFQNPETAEWEVTLFAEPPTWGGRLSHSSTSPVLSIDVQAVTSVFDAILNCRWQTAELSADDDLGAHLSIEGVVHGHAVWLRVLSGKPTVLSDEATPLRFQRN
jgi:hypothetical protein